MKKKLVQPLICLLTLAQLVGCTNAQTVPAQEVLAQESKEQIESNAIDMDTELDENIKLETDTIVEEIQVEWVEQKETEELLEEPVKPIKGNTTKIYKVLYPDLFPEFMNLATLRQGVGGLAKGTVVDVLKDDGKGNYKVTPNTPESTTIVTTTRSNLAFYQAPAILKTEVTVQQIEDHINATQLDSNTDWLVWTNLARQRTYIFKKVDGRWKLIKNFLSSSGAIKTPTPKGIYKLTQKVPSFGQNKGYMCKYAFGFIGTTYLYHSLVFDVTGSYLLGGKGILGTMVSNGCIRFSPEEAKWFYDNLVSGTTVWIN